MNKFYLCIEQVNLYLFQLINAPADIGVVMFRLGVFFADDAVLLFPLVLFFYWFWRGEEYKKAVLHSILSALFSLIINITLGVWWQHPRPFMIPLGRYLMYHVANNSFPSNHVSLACAISISLIMIGVMRTQGFILFAVSIMVAWARIYVGVHFPVDMIVSIVVALVSSILCFRCDKAVDVFYTWLNPIKPNNKDN